MFFGQSLELLELVLCSDMACDGRTPDPVYNLPPAVRTLGATLAACTTGIYDNDPNVASLTPCPAAARFAARRQRSSIVYRQSGHLVALPLTTTLLVAVLQN